jgi:hypothetical protein
MERPVLMWLSYYDPGNPNAEPPIEPRHLGTCIVRASEAAQGRAIARSLGIDPGGDVLTQGLSADSAPFYEAHLERLFTDAELLERFGAKGVLLADGKTPLGVLDRIPGAHTVVGNRPPLSAARKPYEPPSIIELPPTEPPPAMPMDLDRSEYDHPIEALPFSER